MLGDDDALFTSSSTNDLDLPPDVDTFGFQTARHVGVEIVKNL